MDNITLTRQQIESLLQSIEIRAEHNGTYSSTMLETKRILKQALKTAVWPALWRLENHPHVSRRVFRVKDYQKVMLEFYLKC